MKDPKKNEELDEKVVKNVAQAEQILEEELAPVAAEVAAPEAEKPAAGVIKRSGKRAGQVVRLNNRNTNLK